MSGWVCRQCNTLCSMNDRECPVCAVSSIRQRRPLSAAPDDERTEMPNSKFQARKDRIFWLTRDGDGGTYYGLHRSLDSINRSPFGAWFGEVVHKFPPEVWRELSAVRLFEGGGPVEVRLTITKLGERK